MKFGSVCSGIEAASVAWHPLGWTAAWFSEIEPFPCAVLAHHYPEVPNLGDMTAIAKKVLIGEVEAPDLLCGGTPCQAFSVAGLRKSLSDERGNLSLKFVELADAIDHVRVRRGLPPSVVFWENVPGVLNTKDNAFGCFLAGLAGEDEPLQPPGEKRSNAGAVYGPARAVAWRTLDAQYFGVAQRRRRVFVVASSRDGFDPAAVLFEWDSLRRDTAPRREAGQIAPTIPARSLGGGGLGTDFDCDGGVITMAHGQGGAEIAENRSPTLTCDHEAPIAAYGIPGNWIGRKPENGGNAVEPMRDVAPCLTKADQHGVCAAFKGGQGSAAGGIGYDEHVAPTLSSADSGSNRTPTLLQAMQVRRLTPTECERLQGFPDGYTAITWRNKPADQCPDGPRYKAIGNSWAVPNVRWIGQRIANKLSMIALNNDNNKKTEVAA